MKLEHPPGVRTTFGPNGPGKGGKWEPCKYRSEGETRSFSFSEGMSRLGPTEQKLLRSELKRFLRLGEQGKLTLSRDPEPGTVSQMKLNPRVLELRFSSYESLADGDEGSEGERHYRLYYSEPAGIPGKIVLLLFESKAPGPPGLEEQDEHIRKAGCRAESHGLLECIV